MNSQAIKGDVVCGQMSVYVSVVTRALFPFLWIRVEMPVILWVGWGLYVLVLPSLFLKIVRYV